MVWLSIYKSNNEDYDDIFLSVLFLIFHNLKFREEKYLNITTTITIIISTRKICVFGKGGIHSTCIFFK